MREILFRGFHPCEDGDTTIYVEGKAAKGRWVEGFYSHDYLTTEIAYIRYWDYATEKSNTVEVLPSTVGQYTGLTDKNGVKIFKGDMINHFATHGAVIFEDGMFCLDKSAKIQFGKYRQPLCYIDAEYCEVIGTIFDKQEATP